MPAPPAQQRAERVWRTLPSTWSWAVCGCARRAGVRNEFPATTHPARWRRLAIGCVAGLSSVALAEVAWPPAAVRKPATRPSPALIRPRASVLECVQSSAAFAVNQPVTMNTLSLSVGGPFPPLPEGAGEAFT